MKNVMVVGNSKEMQQIFAKLLNRNASACIHESGIFNAIKTIYAKRIDTVIISTKELVDTKLNVFKFLREQFERIKVMVAFDNGFFDFSDMPEDVEIIMPNGFDSIVLGLETYE